MSETKRNFFLIFFATLIFYLPAVLKPEIVLDRGNDLDEFFWPLINFTKQEITSNGSLPLWNNLLLSGTPLLPDPQSLIFYLPNIIFLFLPMGAGFIISFLLHTFLGGLGAYLTSSASGLSKSTSMFVAILYITTPRLAGYLEAGHFGLIASWAFITWVTFATIKLAKSPQVKWSILLALALSGIFYTHLPTFLIVALATVLLWTTLTLSNPHILGRTLFYFLFAFGITLGLIAITLFPQLEWSGYTTRVWLTNDHDIYPKWTSAAEFLQSIFWPWNKIWSLDTEKWLALGGITSILAILGFWQLKASLKLILVTVTIIIAAVALNNASPIYPFLLSQDLFAFLRVSTRVWFPITLLAIFLAGLAVEKLNRTKGNLVLFVVVLAMLESTLLSWTRLLKPIAEANFAPREVYTFLKNDKGQFRIFCLNRCLSQKEAGNYRLQLVEGYSTLQQTNYYKQMWQFTQSYWNYYTLSLPPIGLYNFKEIQPDPKALGEFNVKYIISPHELKNQSLVLEEKIGNFFVYKNLLLLPRGYFWTDAKAPVGHAQILKYTPNHIRVDVTGHREKRLVLAEVWSPGWKAYLNGDKAVKVQEMPNTLRLVDIKPDTRFVDFKYQPDGYQKGKLITSATLILLILLAIRQWKRF